MHRRQAKSRQPRPGCWLLTERPHESRRGRAARSARWPEPWLAAAALFGEVARAAHVAIGANSKGIGGSNRHRTGGQSMKKFALALAAVMAVALASDIAVGTGTRRRWRRWRTRRRAAACAGGGGPVGGGARHGGGSGGSARWRVGGSWSGGGRRYARGHGGGGYGGRGHGGGWSDTMARRLVGSERRRRPWVARASGAGLVWPGLGWLSRRPTTVAAGPFRSLRVSYPSRCYPTLRGRGSGGSLPAGAATGPESAELLVLLHRSRGLLPVRPELLESPGCRSCRRTAPCAERPGAAMIGLLRVTP